MQNQRKHIIKDCWSKAVEKRKNDQYLNKFIEPLAAYSKKKTIKVLSMPAINWFWEQHLLSSFPENKFEFWGVEKDRCKYHLSKAQADILSKEYKKRATFQLVDRACSLNVALESPEKVGMDIEDPFDIVYADYMGSWCPQKLKDVHTLYGSNIYSPRTSIFVMTLGLNVRNSTAFCHDTRMWWSYFQKSLDSVNDQTKLSYYVGIDDDHRHQRYSKPNYSMNTHELVAAIAARSVQVAHGFNKLIDAHNPHIYYAPRGKIQKALPQASFCFTRLL